MNYPENHQQEGMEAQLAAERERRAIFLRRAAIAAIWLSTVAVGVATLVKGAE